MCIRDSLEEAAAIRSLLEGRPQVSAWVSFSCQDGQRLVDGHAIEEAAALFDDLPHVLAVGVNCTEPSNVETLIARLRARGTPKEIVVYPNSGAKYCAVSKSWNDEGTNGEVARHAATWLSGGARLIGGCCRVTPHELKKIAVALSDRGQPSDGPSH